MRTFDFYEFAGILVPGAVVFIAYGLTNPSVWPVLKERVFSAGDFGLFLITAYAAGHLVQAFGNLVEALWWNMRGGMPTDWVRSGRRPLLAPAQISRLHTLLEEKLSLSLPQHLESLSQKDWSAITRQIEASSRGASPTLRSDVFNGNYSLNRGIAAALLANALLLVMQFGYHHWRLVLACAALHVLALYRMDRFGQHYAKSLFVQFMQPPVRAAEDGKAAGTKA